MGSYREEYEKYYQKISAKKQKVSSNEEEEVKINKENDKRIHIKISGADTAMYIVKVNLLNTVACAAIASFIFVGRAYPQGKDVYDYIKQVSKVNFYYKDIIAEETSKFVFNMNGNIEKETESKTTTQENNTGIKPFDDFEVIKKTSSEVLQENGVLPLSGEISFGEVQEIKEKNVLLSSNSDIKVKSIYKGKVKEIGTDEHLGEFIMIDLENGVDIKYSNLKSIYKKVGEEVTTGEIIAEVNNNSDKKINGIILQVIYGGEYKDPKEYINIK